MVTDKQADNKFTKEELAQLFPDGMPIEVVKLLWEADDNTTIYDVRAKVREIAQQAKSAAKSAITDKQVEAAWRAYWDCDEKDGHAKIRAALEAAEAAAWTRPRDGLPEKPGRALYEQIPCLIEWKGDVQISQWNCEHHCWDDFHGDDFMASPSEVARWRPLPQPPKETT